MFNICYFLLDSFQPLFIGSGVCSIIIGSFTALYQVRIKRFLAYTSIVQAGYILLGVACGTLNGILSPLIHLCLYALISLCFFAILINSNDILYGKNIIFFHEFLDYTRYNLNIGLFVCILLMGMGSFPPLATFFSKAFIYVVLLENKLEIIVFIVLGLNILSSLYYLKFIQDIFFFNLGTPVTFYGFYYEPNKISLLVLYLLLMLFCFFVVISGLLIKYLLYWSMSCIWPFIYI